MTQNTFGQCVGGSLGTLPFVPHLLEIVSLAGLERNPAFTDATRSALYDQGLRGEQRRSCLQLGFFEESDVDAAGAVVQADERSLLS